jgi:hypothetical protein
MKFADFTVRVLRPNPHRAKTITWRAGQIVTGMEGCQIKNIVQALNAFEQDTGDAGLGDPSRWLSQFAGLESAESGKQIEAWIEIVQGGAVVRTLAAHRELLRKHA